LAPHRNLAPKTCGNMRRYDEPSLGYYFLGNETINHEYRDADGEKSVETLLKLSFEKIEFIL